MLFASLQSNGQFIDFSENIGLIDFTRSRGLAISDFNNDGLDDFYICRRDLPNQLFKNLGDNQFEDIGIASGLGYGGDSLGALWVDIDNDGDLDLFLGNLNERNMLFLNNGDETFTDITTTARLGTRKFVVQAISAADINGDGWIDIYVSNLNGENAMYRNNGDNTFSNIVLSSGTSDLVLSMGTVFFDYDKDGDQDLYLVHDGNIPNKLFQNDGSGNFTDVGEITGSDVAANGMGVDVADINNDGWLDIYITNLYENNLLINDAGNGFVDISSMSSTEDFGMGWGISFLDYNNGGMNDIYLANDYYYSPYQNIMYKNMGDQSFDIVDSEILASRYSGWALGVADFDQNGFQDILITNSNNRDHDQFLLNDGNGNNWVTFDLKMANENSQAIGACIILETGNKILYDCVTAGTGYASQSSYKIHFGLAESDVVDKITIDWPEGTDESYSDIEVNSVYRITKGKGLDLITQRGEVVTSLEESV